MENNVHLKKTLCVAAFSSAVCSCGAFLIQTQANKATNACSYLDPITIDIVAFLFGLFLLIEGLCDIFKHRNSLVKEQLTRCFRMSIGCGILVIHTMQFMHKGG